MRESIDIKKTGQLLKKIISNAGYKVSDIQKHLGLSCPQPVYRWYSGKALPTVDHLHTLSILLGKHMEELVVTCGDIKAISIKPDLELITEDTEKAQYLRIKLYFSRLIHNKLSG